MRQYTITITPSIGALYLLREDSDRAAKIVATRVRASVGAESIATLHRITDDGKSVLIGSRDARRWRCPRG